MARIIRRKKEGEREPRAKDFKILLGPVLTEKTSMLGGGGQTIAFKVNKKATKDDIREAVERIFKVAVGSVRTINYAGKPKQTARSRGVRAAYKKAYITLKEGHRLDLVEGV